MQRTWSSALALWLIMIGATTGNVLPQKSFAQTAPSNNYTRFEVAPGATIQIGYYASAKKDCSAAPLPDVKVVEPPTSGLLTIRPGVLTTDKISGCKSMKLPALIVFYQARDAATGTDHFVYRVLNQNGDDGLYDVSIVIKAGPTQPATPPGNL